MEKIGMNGNGTVLSQYETPFADIPVMREFADESSPSQTFVSDFYREFESPFSRTYEASAVSNSTTPAGEEYVELLAELHDAEFEETLYELANEVEDTWRSKVSNELEMGSNFLPFVTRQAREYFTPVVNETETMIDRVAQHFSANNLADHSEASVETFFETLEFAHGQYSPAQEQFFGKIFDKVKSVVKKGVDLAKKGIAAVGKILPINVVLNKIKGLVKPLLDKVLKFAIGKLPKSLQPHAKTLAKKLLNLETDEESTGRDQFAGELDGVQAELDNNISQLVFSDGEAEADGTVMEYESSDETAERVNNYSTGYTAIPSLSEARQKFINELQNLKDGESPAPAIERFLPAAILALQPVIKIALSIIGRQKVINFLAGLLAKLVGKYVPSNVAQPLAASIIDVGMSAIGFEVYETGKTDLAYEAIANTIEETVQNMNSVDEAALDNADDITMHLLEAFEQAAAANFPPQYIKEELRPTNKKAVWVSMPRELPVKMYKKFTHIYDAAIDQQTASAITTFRNLPLTNFLKDKYGLDTAKPIKARVHLYEITKNGRLSMINKFEKLPGLNARQPKGWIQLLPLTKQAASLLLKEPALGKDLPAKLLATRFKAVPGQRFYYLEIEGARLRIPPVNRSKHQHAENGVQAATTESRSADIHGVINFIRSEIKLHYYFSEEDAKDIVEKVNRKDFAGAAGSIKQSVKKVLNDILLKNIASKVKIVHEAVPELFLENIPEQESSSLAGLGSIAGKTIISKLIEKIIEKFSAAAYDAFINLFRTRAAEFKEAQAKPQDGVTVTLVWKNIPGMPAVRNVINAARNKSSIVNLSAIAIPNLPVPDIRIVADKKFN